MPITPITGLSMRPTLLALALSFALLSCAPAHADEAIFAGGCFWCTEADFEQLDGVIEAVSGYIGGHTPNPSYEQVSRGFTGHVEAVRVSFDPQRIGYAELLRHFWLTIDPTVDDRQFCDIGPQYRPVIFVLDEAQRTAAQASLEAVRARGRPAPIRLRIETAGTFWPAEDQHQDYYRRHPWRYQYYRKACGRDARLAELWGEQAGGAAAH